MRPLFADVIVDISQADLDRTFSYRVPESMAETLCLGAAVLVPFGNRRIKGCVVALTDEPSCDISQVKDISAVITDESIVESDLVSLAVWMKAHNGGTLNQSLRTVMPWRKTVKDKIQKTVERLLNDEEAAAFTAEAEKKNRKAQARLMTCLLEAPIMDYSHLLKTAGVAAQTLRLFEEKGYVRITQGRIFRKVTADVACETQAAELTEEQEKVRGAILKEWTAGNRPSLIYGVTGSGKTLVYMALIEQILREGKQAIVLIPEIALTYQTVSRFQKRFGSVISFLHSRLSEGEKYDQFRAARAGEITVMVGPRSALFTPFPNLGLVIIDEEHEESYHSESTPRYHARETAIKRAELIGAHVVMGSATPSLRAFYACGQGQFALFRLERRYGRKAMPQTLCLDMKDELRAGNRSIISRRLHDEIALRLEKKEQSMLFLNRRGMLGFVSCRSCGHVEKCPHCDVSLTHHRNGRLICHYCGYEKPMVKICPACQSPLIGGLKAGTEMVENVLRKDFPKARILRMDMDTTKGKSGHDDILKAFAEGGADILVGTQMIVKGHDFPNVTLVGVLLADMSLNDSDYKSSERTFQLVTQAVGRCGRGEKAGLALIQSYDPEHYSLIHATAQDYDGFYEEEIAYRRMMHYPPSSYLAAIHGTSKNEALLDEGMSYLRKFLDRIDPTHKLGTIGPAPESVGKVKDVYRRVIYIRHSDEAMVLKAAEQTEKYIEANKGFEAITVQFDFHA